MSKIWYATIYNFKTAATLSTMHSLQLQTYAKKWSKGYSISLISYTGVLVYLQHVSAKIHSKCASQPKIVKNSFKTHILGVQGRSRSSMKLRLMPNISYAGCPGLSWMVLAQFTPKMRIAPKIAKKITKHLFLWFKVIQGHRCWYRRTARQQCLLWYAASLCLSATILVLD